MVNRIPLRISAGRGTDLLSSYREHEGFLVAVAVGKLEEHNEIRME
jgi:hypothetical protein